MAGLKSSFNFDRGEFYGSVELMISREGGPGGLDGGGSMLFATQDAQPKGLSSLLLCPIGILPIAAIFSISR